MIDRKKMPIVKPSRDIHFPDYSNFMLTSGVKVYLLSDKRYPVTTVRVLIKAGSYNDYFTKGYKSGLSTLTGEMLCKGTEGFSALGIAEKMDVNGLLFASGFGYDASYLSLTGIKDSIDVILQLFSEMLLKPKFNKEELTSKKEQIINSLLTLQDEGSFLSERLFKSVHYKDTPYEFDPDGYVDSLKNITIADIKEFYDSYYRAGGVILAVVGDYDESKIKSQLEKAFGGFNSGTKEDIFIFPEVENGESRVFLTEKKEASQTSLLIGHSGIKRNTDDYIKISFLNTLLGGSFTSRINRNLREKNGLTYGARTSFNARMYAGDFTIETEINTDKTGFAVEEIIKELNDIRENFVSDEEIENARNYITGNYPLQLETSNAVSGKLMTLELYGMDKNYFDTYISSINNITKEDIRETARKYLHPEKLKYIAAGNVSKLEKQLEKFGSVEIKENIK